MTKTKHAPGDCLRTLDRIEEAPKQNRARSGEKKYKGRSRFRTGDLHRLRKGSQPEIASSEREVELADLYSIPGELDTTDTHTPTPEVPRRTSLVRNLRRPWAPREHSPERTGKGFAPPPCAVTLAKCRRYRGTLSCAGRASGGGGHSPWSDTGV